MADVWVLIEFTDDNGKHVPNDQLTYNTDTDAEKAGLALMIDYGIVTDKPPKTETAGNRPGRRSS